MTIIQAIVPIFIVIFIGWAASRKGYISARFTDSANRIVYFLAIPAMVFGSIAKTNLTDQLDIEVVGVASLIPVAIAFLAWLTTCLLNISRAATGTFMQCAFHGNLGYIGFAVAFYFLGSQGLVSAAIVAAFVMIIQNVMGVFLLMHYDMRKASGASIMRTMKTAVVNPVILAAIAGILFSISGVELYTIVDRVLNILKGMALPLALLIIGASLSFKSFKSNFCLGLLICFLKLVVMPFTAWQCFVFLSIPKEIFLPALIILAAPSATLTYVMAKELGGDPDLATGAISLSTLFSAVTYIIWLNLV